MELNTGMILDFFKSNAFISIISAVAGSVATILLTLIYKKMTLPKLIVSTSLGDEALFTQINGNDFSLKLDVSNIGKSDAEQVQLSLNKIIFENQEQPVEPLQLTWSYQDAKSEANQPLETQTSIQAGSHSHCDFLFFIYHSKYKPVLASQVMQFNELKNNGHYKIELAVGAKDIKTAFWEIEFNINPESADKNKIISRISCYKKNKNTIIENIPICLFVVLEFALFFGGVLKRIEKMSNLKFFIVSFGYLIVCFSLDQFLINRKEGKC